MYGANTPTGSAVPGVPSPMDPQSLEQTIAPRPTSSNEYSPMPWPGAAQYGNHGGNTGYGNTSGYGPQTPGDGSRMGGSPPCGMNSSGYSGPSVGNSIANLRLKAREYASNVHPPPPPSQHYPMPHHQMA